MNRREALQAVFAVLSAVRANTARPSVSTLIGTGSLPRAGCSFAISEITVFDR